MTLRRAMIWTAFVLLMAGGVWADPAAEPGSAGDERRAPLVEAAPGGGDMVILGPEFQYVIDGRVDHTGRPHAGCVQGESQATRAETVRE